MVRQRTTDSHQRLRDEACLLLKLAVWQQASMLGASLLPDALHPSPAVC